MNFSLRFISSDVVYWRRRKNRTSSFYGWRERVKNRWCRFVPEALGVRVVCVMETPMRWKAEGAEEESPQQIFKSNTSSFTFQSRTQSTMGSLLPLHVPDDIALQIASLLPVWDLCALGSCSRFWRELCKSDCVWECLVRRRWSLLEFSDHGSSSSSSTAIEKPTSMGWRSFYIELHNEKAAIAAAVVQFVEKCSSSESLEVGEYQKAMRNLNQLQFGYQDVEMFLFKPKLTVLVNLLGLHYCLNWLRVPAECVLKALQSSRISERQVCVKWWTLGRWSHGYRMRDELCSRCFTLLDFGLAKQEEVLAVLYRGAVHEVLRVQICVADPSSTSWSCQGARREGKKT
ncbi:hypothetical protein ACFX13_043197 [Malus domestica]